MAGFKDYLAGLKKLPDREHKDPYGIDPPPKKGEVRNPLYHRKGERVWGPNEGSYLPPRKHSYDAIMAAKKAGKPISDWDHLPVTEIDTKDLVSPQRELDLHHLETHPKSDEPISVVRTKNGQHIIIDGNHRAAIAHGTTGKVKAQVFQSEIR